MRQTDSSVIMDTNIHMNIPCFMLYLTPMQLFIMNLVLLMLFILYVICVALGASDLKQIPEYDYARHSIE